MVTTAILDLRQIDGPSLGTIAITCLPGRTIWNGMETLIDRRDEPRALDAAAPVQLLEEIEYGYDVILRTNSTVVRIGPKELFSPTTPDLLSGRLKVGRSTGTIRLEVGLVAGEEGACDLEVRSRKLDYESEYQWMLSRIAEVAAELIQARFAATSLPNFEPNSEQDAQTLYQRFAFVQALLSSGELDEAFHIIGNRPHLEYRTETFTIHPGHAIRPRSGVVRQLVGPGPREPINRPIAGLTTLPRTILDQSHVETYDTLPNRFVRFALRRWRDLADDVARLLNGNGAAEERGRREAEQLTETLSALMAAPAIVEAGELTALPLSNTVLQGRAGYRDILRAFLLAEAAATITWNDGKELFRAGQRDVATLYEYWVFLELVRVVASLRGFASDQNDLGLVSLSQNRLHLGLRRGCVVRIHGERRGQPVQVELWFNRQFGHIQPSARATGSWTEIMRPDCSVCITPQGPRHRQRVETWIHFDAKYRVQQYRGDFSTIDDVAFDSEALDGTIVAGARSVGEKPIAADLLKMHAYRDAIRRTAGAYVLYPGGDGPSPPSHRQYHEIVPGLGAFVLRPTDNGKASDAAIRELRRFLEDVIDHIASEGTSAGRSRYWTDLSYQTTESDQLPFSRLIDKPADDTRVLLGFLKSPAHRQWVLQHHMYNLRADPYRNGSVGINSPEVSADFILLYDALSEDALLLPASGALYLRSAKELADTGYPQPTGQTYLCLGLDSSVGATLDFSEGIRDLSRHGRERSSWAAPFVVTWRDIAPLIDRQGQSG